MTKEASRRRQAWSDLASDGQQRHKPSGLTHEQAAGWYCGLGVKSTSVEAESNDVLRSSGVAGPPGPDREHRAPRKTGPVVHAQKAHGFLAVEVQSVIRTDSAGRTSPSTRWCVARQRGRFEWGHPAGHSLRL